MRKKRNRRNNDKLHNETARNDRRFADRMHLLPLPIMRPGDTLLIWEASVS